MRGPVNSFLEALAATHLDRDIPREHHLPALLACEPLVRSEPPRPRLPLLRQLRIRFPPGATRQHSQSPHFRPWRVLADRRPAQQPLLPFATSEPNIEMEEFFDGAGCSLGKPYSSAF